MILADTTVWIDHLRIVNPEMGRLLQNGDVAMHPFVVAEVALGSLRDRRNILTQLDLLIRVKVASLAEVRLLIETQALYSKGIGLIDASLAASCLITPGTKLWTRDLALQRVARSLGIHANIL
jgi:predicted nucleic acid-binding protein